MSHLLVRWRGRVGCRAGGVSLLGVGMGRDDQWSGGARCGNGGKSAVEGEKQNGCVRVGYVRF